MVVICCQLYLLTVLQLCGYVTQAKSLRQWYRPAGLRGGLLRLTQVGDLLRLGASLQRQLEAPIRSNTDCLPGHTAASGGDGDVAAGEATDVPRRCNTGLRPGVPTAATAAAAAEVSSDVWWSCTVGCLGLLWRSTRSWHFGPFGPGCTTSNSAPRYFSMKAANWPPTCSQQAEIVDKALLPVCHTTPNM